jgi:hypothetical protein
MFNAYHIYHHHHHYPYNKMPNRYRQQILLKELMKILILNFKIILYIKQHL